jgi:hypothetical protein
VRERAAQAFKEVMAGITPVIEEVITSTLELDTVLASERY